MQGNIACNVSSTSYFPKKLVWIFEAIFKSSFWKAGIFRDELKKEELSYLSCPFVLGLVKEVWVTVRFPCCTMSEEQTTDDTWKGRREGGMVEPQAAEFKQKPKFHYAEKYVMLP